MLKDEIDISGVAETFLNDDVMQDEINIEGYTIFRTDRCSFREGKGGGVILYVNN